MKQDSWIVETRSIPIQAYFESGFPYGGSVDFLWRDRLGRYRARNGGELTPLCNAWAASARFAVTVYWARWTPGRTSLKSVGDCAPPTSKRC